MTSALAHNDKLAGSLLSLFHQFQNAADRVRGVRGRRCGGCWYMDKQREKRRTGRGERLFLSTIVCVHHLQSMCVCVKEFDVSGR